MKRGILIILILVGYVAKGQNIQDIYFNLYTDSLKKGVYNYINVDAKLSNGQYFPLMANEINFSSSYGKWQGNSLIIDSAYCKDSVVVTATLKSKPDVTKSITIYLKKILTEPPLKTEEELLNDWKKKRRG